VGLLFKPSADRDHDLRTNNIHDLSFLDLLQNLLWTKLGARDFTRVFLPWRPTNDEQCTDRYSQSRTFGRKIAVDARSCLEPLHTLAAFLFTG
jgi:hypothetical protein